MTAFVWLRWVESPALLPAPSAHTQAHTTSDIVQTLTPFLWFAFIFSLRTERVYTKGGFSAGLPAAFSPIFSPSLYCRSSLPLREPAGLLQPGAGAGGAEGSSRRGELWVACPDAAHPTETAGRPACSLPAPCQAGGPSAWPQGLLPPGWGGTG